MRILTQDETELLSIDNFLINDKAQITGYSVIDPKTLFLLGSYNDLDEAKKVLKLISEHSALSGTYHMPNSISIVDIADLCLSVRSYNILKAAGYNYVGDLIKNRSELPFLKNIGRKTLKEIEEAIQNYVR